MIFSDSSASKILIHLSINFDMTGSKLSKDLNITYNHVFLVLKRLEKIKMIKIGKLVGRSRLISTTRIGESIAIKLREINKLLEW